MVLGHDSECHLWPLQGQPHTIVRIVKDLGSGMGWLGPDIEANHAIISRTLIPHLAKIMGHPSCITCLRPRQVCEFGWPPHMKNWGLHLLPSLHWHWRTSPGDLTASAYIQWRCPHLDLPWPQLGLYRIHHHIHRMDPTRTASFPTPTSWIHGHLTGQSMGGAPSTSMGGMPPLRQTCPTTQLQQPHQQATLILPLWMFPGGFPLLLKPAPLQVLPLIIQIWWEYLPLEADSLKAVLQRGDLHPPRRGLQDHRINPEEVAGRVNTGDGPRGPSPLVTPLSRWCQRIPPCIQV